MLSCPEILVALPAPSMLAGSQRVADRGVPCVDIRLRLLDQVTATIVMCAHSLDAIILGAGVGGVAAALALARAGRTVALVAEHDWIGGQLTTQAVPPDEHGWIEHFGCTASYRVFRNRVREHYRQHYPLLPRYRNQAHLNPGNGWVSPLCHEPRVALAVLEGMLAPHVAAGRLHLLRRQHLVGVRLRDAQLLHSVTVRRQPDGVETTLAAPYFLDATENGDLLPLAGIEHVTGSEAQADTGEPGAPAAARPDNVQAISVCFVLEHLAGENHVIPEPDDYAHWRDYTPRLSPPWPGSLLRWEGINPRTMQRMTYRFDPHNEEPGLFAGLWAFRRIIDRAQFAPGSFRSDLCLVNWPMLDYLDGNLLTGDAATRARHVDQARRQSRSLLRWLQTEAPRPDGGSGWPGLRLRGDLTGSADGLAQAPYIREARRIRAVRTVREQDVAQRQRPGETLGERYADSVGIGYYRIDLHPTCGGDNYVDVPSLPFRIPLGALIPVRAENVLPAAKNIGVTHITNGCYRLHPVEWNVGEAAGALVAYCLDQATTPRAVQATAQSLHGFQNRLRQQGFELAWPENLDLADGDPHAHASPRGRRS
jgi:hypothetical protein